MTPAGGKRPGAGRKSIGVQSRTVTLLPCHWEMAERKGGGNVSAGLRNLLDAVDRLRLRKRANVRHKSPRP